jgi:hypothetical protein
VTDHKSRNANASVGIIRQAARFEELGSAQWDSIRLESVAFLCNFGERLVLLAWIAIVARGGYESFANVDRRPAQAQKVTNRRGNPLRERRICLGDKWAK